MAQRRMFSMKVVDTDAFCEMPASAQNLYFHIGMRADDDGFYAGVKGLMAKIHAGQDDLNCLLGRRYLLDRGDGVYVVKHWKMNNYLQSDRYTPTEYGEKKNGLYVKSDGSYTLDPRKAEISDRKPCIQNVYTGKVSIGKDSIDKYSKESSTPEVVEDDKKDKYDKVLCGLTKGLIGKGFIEEEDLKIYELDDYLKTLDQCKETYVSLNYILSRYDESKVRDKVPWLIASMKESLSRSGGSIEDIAEKAEEMKV